MESSFGAEQPQALGKRDEGSAYKANRGSFNEIEEEP